MALIMASAFITVPTLAAEGNIFILENAPESVQELGETDKTVLNMSQDKILWFVFDQMTYELRYQLIHQIGIGLDITNREAEVYVECETYEKAEISITARLQQLKNGSWQTIKTFSNTENTKLCSIQEYKTLTAGYDYRVDIDVTVDDGNYIEKVSKTGKTVYCN